MATKDSAGRQPPRRQRSKDQIAEDEVASIYRALGYHVETNVVRSGAQIDVLASKQIPGLGVTVVHIEVKSTERPSLPKSEVEEFVMVAGNLQRAGNAHRSVLVSTGNVTPQSKALVADHPSISLSTLEELRNELLPVDRGLNLIVLNQRDDPRNDLYLDLAVHQITGAPFEPAVTRVSQLSSAARQRAGAAVALLADYGGGKTTALHHLNFEAARARLEDPTAPVPFLIELKRLESFSELADFVADGFRRCFQVDLPPDHLMRLVDDGRFLLLLDGFDEITLRADQGRRAQLLQRLAPLLLSSSPAVLTSRPSFFVSRAEYEAALASLADPLAPRLGQNVDMNRRVNQAMRGMAKAMPHLLPQRDAVEAPDTVTFELGLLEDDQIDEYLERCEPRFAEVNLGWRDVRTFINSIYDLSDLMKRPIQLEMIVITVLQGVLDPKNEVVQLGPSGLYELYATMKVQADDAKAESRREVLTTSDRMSFAEDCAERMLVDDALELTSDEVTAIAIKQFGSRNLDMHDVLTDLRTCSFLTIRDDGSMRFIHRSFQEFFLARRISHNLGNSQHRLIRRVLTPETLDFVGGSAAFDNDVYETLRAALRRAGTGDTPHRDNLATALIAARESIDGLELGDAGVQALSRKRLRLRRSNLAGTTFLKGRLEHVDIADSRLDPVEFNFGGTAELSIENSEGSVSVYGDMVKVNARSCPALLLTSDETTRLSIDVYDSDINVSVGTHVEGVRVEKATVTMTPPAPSSLHASLSIVDIEAVGNATIDVDVDSSILRLWGADRAVLRGSISASTLVVQPSRQGNDYDPNPVTIVNSILYTPPGIPVDATNWTATNVGFIGTMPAMSANVEAAACGVCLLNDREPDRSASKEDRENGIVEWGRLQRLVVAGGYGAAMRNLRDELTRWAKPVRGAEHLTTNGLVALLVKHGCENDLAAAAAADIDGVRRIVVQRGSPGPDR